MEPRPAPAPVNGTEPAFAAAAPARGDGTRFGSYAAALGALRRPALFEDRACYRLLEAWTTPAGAKLGFGEGRYFEVINIVEAVAHEYARRHRSPARGDRPWPPRQDRACRLRCVTDRRPHRPGPGGRR